MWIAAPLGRGEAFLHALAAAQSALVAARWTPVIVPLGCCFRIR
jgi:hypothetical protein